MIHNLRLTNKYNLFQVEWKDGFDYSLVEFNNREEFVEYINFKFPHLAKAALDEITF